MCRKERSRGKEEDVSMGDIIDQEKEIKDNNDK